MATARKTAVARAAAQVAAPAKKRVKLEAVTTRERVRLVTTSDPEEGLGQASTYITDTNKEGIEFVRAGCAVFDAMCGGGYPLGPQRRPR